MIKGLEAINKVREIANANGSVTYANAADDFCEIIRDDEIEFESEEELSANFEEFAKEDLEG
jgi:hypothetical protein